MADKPYHDKETLERLYHKEEMTTREISNKFGVSQGTIATWMGKLDIDTRTPAESRELRGTHHRPIKEGPHTNEKWLREKYWGEKKTLAEIAEEAGLEAESSVMEWMDRFDIERREKSVAFTLADAGAGFVQADPSGYETIKHSVDGTTKQYKIHRLVAMAEYGIDEVMDKRVHHKNGVPWDNRPENLELVNNQKEHAQRHKDMWGNYGPANRARDEKGRFTK